MFPPETVYREKMARSYVSAVPVVNAQSNESTFCSIDH